MYDSSYLFSQSWLHFVLSTVLSMLCTVLDNYKYISDSYFIHSSMNVFQGCLTIWLQWRLCILLPFKNLGGWSMRNAFWSKRILAILTRLINIPYIHIHTSTGSKRKPHKDQHGQMLLNALTTTTSAKNSAYRPS